MTEINNDQLFLDEYTSGLTIRDIAKKYNISYETIRKKLLKLKVKWHRNYISDFSKEQINDILMKFDNGMSINKLSSWYEIAPKSISKLLEANNRKIIENNKKYDILRAVPINKIQKEILVGMLLGDGCLHKDTPNGNYKLSFGHCIEQEGYFQWKYLMYDPFVNCWRKSEDKRGNSTMLQTATICHQEFNRFADMFYDEYRIKHVPDNLDMYLTPIALATWIQDNGNLNEGVNMRIASMCFTEAENYKLQDYLYRCYNLRSKVMGYTYKGNQYWQITINKENTQKLSDIIRPYVVECMQYKLMPESSTSRCQAPTKVG